VLAHFQYHESRVYEEAECVGEKVLLVSSRLSANGSIWCRATGQTQHSADGDTVEFSHQIPKNDLKAELSAVCLSVSPSLLSDLSDLSAQSVQTDETSFGYSMR